MEAPKPNSLRSIQIDENMLRIKAEFIFLLSLGSRHSSYTSHQSRMSYTSHGDLLSGGMTKESRLRVRSSRLQQPIISQPTLMNTNIDGNYKASELVCFNFSVHLKK